MNSPKENDLTDASKLFEGIFFIIVVSLIIGLVIYWAMLG